MTKAIFMKFFTFPILLVVSILSFLSYMAWSEYTMNNLLVEKSLAGNCAAIQILMKYEKPWKLDRRIVDAAIEGNVNAIKVLNLNPTDCGRPSS